VAEATQELLSEFFQILLFSLFNCDVSPKF
jgi:hypothetical protein